MSDLMSCPFCGGEALYYCPCEMTVYVKCTKCQAIADKHMWNQRWTMEVIRASDTQTE